VIRVLNIVPGKIFGGVETALITTAQFRALFPEMAFEIGVCFQGRLSRELIALGVPVHFLGEVRVRNPGTVWRARRRLRDLLRHQRYDVVFCHMPWAQAIFGPVARGEDLPLAYGAHGPCNRSHWTERWASLTRPDAAICISRFLSADVSTLYPAIPTEVVYNPIAAVLSYSPWERTAVRAQANTSRDAVVIAQACRMEPGKGHRVCIKALASLRDLPGWECWQIGGAQRASEREYFESLREQAARLGIGDRVRFWGQRADVPRLLAAADIYCQPNDTFIEGLGNVFVEAMHAGLPVVTSAIGAAPEVIDETCGCLLAPGDVAAVAAALEKLIRDAGFRARLAAGGRARAETQFAPATQIPRLCEALSNTIQRKQIPVQLSAQIQSTRIMNSTSGDRSTVSATIV
jgi:glycosyltransferase involved in cell wall biosynthesis